MSFFSNLFSTVGNFVSSNPIASAAAAVGAVGAATSFSASRDSADALDRQAAQVAELGDEEARFLIEQSELEAELILEEGLDQADVLAFNQAVALENAAWERRAGDVAFEQSRKRWESHVKNTVAQFAASGARLDGTTNDVILEQIDEMEEELFNIGLNTERAATQQETQGNFFSLQRDQVKASAKRRSEGRKAIGLLESDTAETAASARSQAARTQANTASITGTAGLFKSGSSLLGSIAEFSN